MAGGPGATWWRGAQRHRNVVSQGHAGSLCFAQMAWYYDRQENSEI